MISNVPIKQWTKFRWNNHHHHHHHQLIGWFSLDAHHKKFDNRRSIWFIALPFWVPLNSPEKQGWNKTIESVEFVKHSVVAEGGATILEYQCPSRGAKPMICSLQRISHSIFFHWILRLPFFLLTFHKNLEPLASHLEHFILISIQFIYSTNNFPLEFRSKLLNFSCNPLFRGLNLQSGWQYSRRNQTVFLMPSGNQKYTSMWFWA